MKVTHVQITEYADSGVMWPSGFLGAEGVLLGLVRRGLLGLFVEQSLKTYQAVISSRQCLVSYRIKEWFALEGDH